MALPATLAQDCGLLARSTAKEWAKGAIRGMLIDTQSALKTFFRADCNCTLVKVQSKMALKIC